MTTEWRAPARIDDLLDVRTVFRAAKGARLLLDQEIWKEATLLARAEVEAVCMTADGRPRRFPGDIAAKLAAGRD